MVYIYAVVPLNIKYKKGNTNNVTNYLSLLLVMALTNVLDSYGHENLGWPHLYNSDPKFITTYQILLEAKKVLEFYLCDALYVTRDTSVLLHVSMPI